MIPTEEQVMIRDMARAFAAEQIAPFAAEWEDKAYFPAEVFKAMGKLGLMGMGRRRPGLCHLRHGVGGDRLR